MQLSSLRTPSLLLDRAALERNARRMSTRARELGVKLRPHLKTAKCAEVARIAHGGKVGPITVATLREAEFFADRGFDDITVAAVVTPDKLDRAAEISADHLRLLVDDAATAAAVAAHPADLSALVEVDCGEHRTGVPAEQTPGLASILGRRFAGLLTHAGHSYRCRTVGEIRAVAQQERDEVVRAAKACRSAGHPAKTVSVGSTPTAVHAADLNGVTEMRPGVYLLGDLFQVGIHSIGLDDVASTVLATVISVRPDQVVIDAGGLALSKDRSTAALDNDRGYGLITDSSGRLLEGLMVVDVHQEHGEVRGPAPSLRRLRLGDRVRVMPNHICMTAAAYDHFEVVESDQIVGRWQRCTGW